MTALFSFEWVTYLGPALGAVAFVLIGVAVASRLRWRRRIKRSVKVARKTSERALRVAMDDETPDTMSERDWRAIGLPLEIDPDTSRPYINRWESP